ncbi:hypothetical protein HELRODRAFT_70010, partial [Helobdella robusta]|uniref:AMP-dependent synthetase/ligase domain-containing protein n=1 Tax=Helobdella robusta TaxID=6412 RepID=T1G015_HELRO
GRRVASILFSSGTTGFPKGVMQSHRNLVASQCVYSHPNMCQGIEDALNSITYQPMSHSYGMFRVMFCLSHCITNLLMSKFNLELYLKTIEQYKMTCIQLVPPVAIMICNSQLLRRCNVSSVQTVYSSAAPMGKQLERRLKDAFNNRINIIQGYGMTESSGTLTQIPGMLANILITTQVVEPGTGLSVGSNKRGEIWLKGDNVMLGYLNNLEATKIAITEDGWLKTGDIGYYDESKYFFVVDRLKEFIKCKGYQVAPAELESILLEHPCVDDVAVVGVAHPIYGEVPRAFVVRRKESNEGCTEEVITNWLADKVSPFKRLYGGVKFVHFIPKSSSGKILRKEVRKMIGDSKL